MKKKIIYIIPLLFISSLVSSQTSQIEDIKYETNYISNNEGVDNKSTYITTEEYSNEIETNNEVLQDIPFLDMSSTNDHITPNNNSNKKHNKEYSDKKSLNDTDSITIQKDTINSTDSIIQEETSSKLNVDSTYSIFFKERESIKFKALPELKTDINNTDISLEDNIKEIKNRVLHLRPNLQDVIIVGLFSIFLISIVLFLIKNRI